MQLVYVHVCVFVYVFVHAPTDCRVSLRVRVGAAHILHSTPQVLEGHTFPLLIARVTFYAEARLLNDGCSGNIQRVQMRQALIRREVLNVSFTDIIYKRASNCYMQYNSKRS